MTINVPNANFLMILTMTLHVWFILQIAKFMTIRRKQNVRNALTKIIGMEHNATAVLLWTQTVFDAQMGSFVMNVMQFKATYSKTIINHVEFQR